MCRSSDWVLAIAGAFAAPYLFLFYGELATRPGQPTTHGHRRRLGRHAVAARGDAALAGPGRWSVLALLFIAVRVCSAPTCPTSLAHKGASLQRLLSHMWLTTEGVFGIALGVSPARLPVRAVRLAAGPGRRRQLHDPGLASRCSATCAADPAKVAVVSSALNGIVSGSSVSNVVSGGIFTIPLMKRAGYRRREGGRDRDRLLGQRPDHAAGDGRGRVPDGRVRRHPVHRDRRARRAAGA